MRTPLNHLFLLKKEKNKEFHGNIIENVHSNNNFIRTGKISDEFLELRNYLNKYDLMSCFSETESMSSSLSSFQSTITNLNKLIEYIKYFEGKCSFADSLLWKFTYGFFFVCLFLFFFIF
jgi:hypothetical protein